MIGRGGPPRELHSALTEIASHTNDSDLRRALIEQAAMIERSARESLTEQSDLFDVPRRSQPRSRRRYRCSRLPATGNIGA